MPTSEAAQTLIRGAACRSLSPRVFFPLLLLPVAVFAAACAKTGDPQPPVLMIPKAAADLQLRQYSGQAHLTVSLPVENTNGTAVSTLDRVELLRVAEPDRANTTPLPEDDFVRRAEIIAAISVEDIPAHSSAGKFGVRDALGVPDPTEIYRTAFRYAVRFVNNKNQAAGLSNQVFFAPIPIPPPPDNLGTELNQERIRLTWTAPARNEDGSQPPTIAGYNVYRGDSPTTLAGAPLNSQPVGKTEFEDRNFEFGKTYYYSVSVIARTEPYAESLPSPAIALEARDTFPPGAPENLNAILEPGAAILLWSAPPESDVAGYRVYRTSPGSAERQLLIELVKEPSYRDEKVQQGKHVYSVHAVDTHGNAGPGAEVAVEVP